MKRGLAEWPRLAMTAHTNIARLIREVESNSSGRIIMAQDSNPRRLIIFLCRRSICFRKLKEGGNTYTQHKTYGKKSGGRGEIGSTGPKAGPNFGPSALCIVHKAGSARLYARVNFQLLRWDISARLWGKFGREKKATAISINTNLQKKDKFNKFSGEQMK